MENIIDVESKEVSNVTTSIIVNNDSEVAIVKDSSLPTGLVFNSGSQSLEPILTVTNTGEFLWDTNTQERLESDNFSGFESMKYVLVALWKSNGLK